jgi:Hypoxia induced protein conserved region
LSASWLSKLRVFGGGSPYLKIGRRVVYERSQVLMRWRVALQFIALCLVMAALYLPSSS